MSKLRRFYHLGQTYFITAVTDKRAPILIQHRDIFWSAITKTAQEAPFDLHAWVVLPDHFHIIMTPLTLPPSHILRRIKLKFAYGYRNRLGMYRGKVWQPRFWDRVIRDEADMERHVNYILFNPVKHGLAQSSTDWQDSSIHVFGGVMPPVTCPRTTLSSNAIPKFGE